MTDENGLPAVTADDVPEPIVPAVQEAIMRAFPKDGEDILRNLHYSPVNGCYWFERWGMFVGVETDGYIHS